MILFFCSKRKPPENEGTRYQEEGCDGLCVDFSLFSPVQIKDEEGKPLLFLEFCSLVWSQLF